jgi:signal transduction histidine kinase
MCAAHMESMTSTTKRPLRVLLLEDQSDDELLLRRSLSDGYELTVERVDSAAAMRRALATHEWDMIVSDYEMPSFTALDALKILHEDGRDLPFIIVSGTMTEETAVKAMRAGAHDYMMKDNLARLKPAVERELHEAVRRRALRLAEAERDRLLVRERELREAAEAAGRSKDEFLAVLSHELRTPLTCILGWARMLRSRRKQDPAAAQGVEAIERNGRILTRLIEDLLDLSAMLNGRLRLRPYLVDFAAIVRAATDTIGPTAADNGVTIDSELANECTVWGDPDRLSHIVVNLLTNAVKFTPKGGRVSISLRGSATAATLVVRDTGIGIPADFLPYVFERFRQADGSMSRAFSGLGLGLSIVRQLVEMHGGRVSAESGGAGQGSTFTVHIPTTMAVRTVKNDFPEGALRGRTVLAVAGSSDDRDVIRAALEHFGAAVVSVSTAIAMNDALNWAAADLLIVDVELPLEDGYDLIATIRRTPRLANVPAIALTTSDDPIRRQRILGAGFNSYFTKPVTAEAIVTKVADLVQHLATH